MKSAMSPGCVKDGRKRKREGREIAGRHYNRTPTHHIHTTYRPPPSSTFPRTPHLSCTHLLHYTQHSARAARYTHATTLNSLATTPVILTLDAVLRSLQARCHSTCMIYLVRATPHSRKNIAKRYGARYTARCARRATALRATAAYKHRKRAILGGSATTVRCRRSP